MQMNWPNRLTILRILMVPFFILFLLTELGSDPFNVLIQGLFRSLSSLTGWGFLTHGRVHIAVCLLIILILLFVDRSYIKIGTVLCMIFGGPIIDMFTAVLSPLQIRMLPVPGRILILAAGCVIAVHEDVILVQLDELPSVLSDSHVAVLDIAVQRVRCLMACGNGVYGELRAGVHVTADKDVGLRGLVCELVSHRSVSAAELDLGALQEISPLD